MKRMTIPNEAAGFVAEELRNRLREGHTVRIAFGGNSMWPMLDGEHDTVELAPLEDNAMLQVGEIYLFEHLGRCVVHRLIRQEGDWLLMRGDHNMSMERVRREDVMAQLVAVVHEDGSREQCDTRRWRRRSRRVAWLRNVRMLLGRWFGRRQRVWERWVYLGALLLLMWLPLAGLGVPLDNFVLGIRLDHLIHASVYLPCAFFFCDLRMGGKGLSIGQRRGRLLLASLLLAATTEAVQYLLPYRGFDINDLVANFLGVTVGWVVARRLVRDRTGE